MLVDTGASYLTYLPDMSVVIPSVNPAAPISVEGAYLLCEFGLNIDEPSLPSPPNYNAVQHSGSVGVQSINQTGVKVRLIVTQTPTNNLLNENIIYVADELFLNTNIAEPTQNIMTYSSNIGGYNNSIDFGYYRYRLYIVQLNANPDNNTLICGPVTFQAASYLSNSVV